MQCPDCNGDGVVCYIDQYQSWDGIVVDEYCDWCLTCDGACEVTQTIYNTLEPVWPSWNELKQKES